MTIQVSVENNQEILPVIIQELKNKNKPRYESVIQKEIIFENLRILYHLSES